MFVGSRPAEAAIHYSGLLDITVPGDGFHRVELPLDKPGDSIAFEHRASIFGFSDEWAGFQARRLKGGSFWRDLIRFRLLLRSEVRAWCFCFGGSLQYQTETPIVRFWGTRRRILRLLR